MENIRFDTAMLAGSEAELYFVHTHGGTTTFNAFGLFSPDQETTFFGNLTGLKATIRKIYEPESDEDSPFVHLFATRELAKTQLENHNSGKGVLITIKVGQLTKSWVFKFSTVLEKLGFEVDKEEDAVCASYLVLHRVPIAAIISAFSLGPEQGIPFPIMNHKLTTLAARGDWSKLVSSLHRLQVIATRFSGFCSLKEGEDHDAKCLCMLSEKITAFDQYGLPVWENRCSGPEVTGLIQGKHMNHWDRMLASKLGPLLILTEKTPGCGLAKYARDECDQIEMQLNFWTSEMREGGSLASTCYREILGRHKFGTTLLSLAALAKNFRCEIMGTANGKKWQLCLEDYTSRPSLITRETYLQKWAASTTELDATEQRVHSL